MSTKSSPASRRIAPKILEAVFRLALDVWRHGAVRPDAELAGAKDELFGRLDRDAVAVAGERGADRGRIERPEHKRGTLRAARVS